MSRRGIKPSDVARLPKHVRDQIEGRTTVKQSLTVAERPKRAKTTSPTQRSLAHYKKLGAVAAVVEKWNPYARVRQDLFGIFDLVVLHECRIIGVQVTSRTHHAARRTKMVESDVLRTWTASGGLAIVHSWLKSKKSLRWELKEEVVQP